MPRTRQHPASEMLSSARQRDQQCPCPALPSLPALRGVRLGPADLGASPHLPLPLSRVPRLLPPWPGEAGRPGPVPFPAGLRVRGRSSQSEDPAAALLSRFVRLRQRQRERQTGKVTEVCRHTQRCASPPSQLASPGATPAGAPLGLGQAGSSLQHNWDCLTVLEHCCNHQGSCCR